jgi:hypothetical protein
MLHHKAKVSKYILKWVSESTIDVHKITEEHLCPISPDVSLDKGMIRGSNLYSVCKCGESVGCNLNSRILSDSTARIEKNTHVKLNLGSWLCLVKYEKRGILCRVTNSPQTVLID